MSRPDAAPPHHAELDVLRGLAALVVMAGHARAFIFAAPDAGLSFLDRLFYLATGFGHQAVMVFFVASGFLVGGAVHRAWQSGRWWWRDYLVRRLTRLWAVLVPCLVLTWITDLVAIRLTGSSFYSGGMGFYGSGPISGAAGYEPQTFLGNLLFVQGILVPTFGSNGPLWSLANEFWYYLIFPSLYLAVMAPLGSTVRILGIVLAILTMALLPREMLALGFIWLMGFLVVLAWEWRGLRRFAKGRLFLALGIVAFAVPLMAARVAPENTVSHDLAVGFGTAVLLLAIVAQPRLGFGIHRLGGHLARISYSMYLFHFPFFALVAALLLDNRTLPPSPLAYGIWLLMMVAGVCLGQLAWLAFERHTDSLRRWVAGWALARPRRIAAS